MIFCLRLKSQIILIDSKNLIKKYKIFGERRSCNQICWDWRSYPF